MKYHKLLDNVKYEDALKILQCAEPSGCGHKYACCACNHTQQWCQEVLEYTCTSLREGEQLKPPEVSKDKILRVLLVINGCASVQFLANLPTTGCRTLLLLYTWFSQISKNANWDVEVWKFQQLWQVLTLTLSFIMFSVWRWPAAECQGLLRQCQVWRRSEDPSVCRAL